MNDNYNTQNNTNTETTAPSSFGETLLYLLLFAALAIGAIVLLVGAIKFVFAVIGYMLYQAAGTILLGLFLAIVLIPLCL